ncbi:hypothetical protein CKO27_03195 [Thiocystis violacea]|nr:hypothetical protein [Thiocystis violacea]
MDKARQSQYDRIKAALLARAPVDPVSAFQHGLGVRVAASIHRLRRRDGWPIETFMDERGLAHYALPDGWQPPVDPCAGHEKGPMREHRAVDLGAQPGVACQPSVDPLQGIHD